MNVYILDKNGQKLYEEVFYSYPQHIGITCVMQGQVTYVWDIEDDFTRKTILNEELVVTYHNTTHALYITIAERISP